MTLEQEEDEQEGDNTHRVEAQDVSDLKAAYIELDKRLSKLHALSPVLTVSDLHKFATLQRTLWLGITRLWITDTLTAFLL